MGQSLSLVKFEKECQSALRKVDVRVKVDKNMAGKGLPLKEQDSSIIRLKKMLKGTFKKEEEVQIKNSSTQCFEVLPRAHFCKKYVQF